MCLGSIAVLVEAWDERGVLVGRLDGGRVVPLTFVPDAAEGAYLPVRTGIPAERLDPGGRARGARRPGRRRGGVSSRALGIALAFAAAAVSGVSFYVTGHAVGQFPDATAYTTV
jgi:hypothetical protein